MVRWQWWWQWGCSQTTATNPKGEGGDIHFLISKKPDIHSLFVYKIDSPEIQVIESKI